MLDLLRREKPADLYCLVHFFQYYFWLHFLLFCVTTIPESTVKCKTVLLLKTKQNKTLICEMDRAFDKEEGELTTGHLSESK